MKEDLNLFKGLIWGITFSIPLWFSLFGWIRIITKIFLN